MTEREGGRRGREGQTERGREHLQLDNVHFRVFLQEIITSVKRCMNLWHSLNCKSYANYVNSVWDLFYM